MADNSWSLTYFDLSVIDENAYFILDYSPPLGTILINDGDYFTTNQNVTLTITLTTVETDPVEMMISNDPTFSSATWESFSSSKAWTLTNNYEFKRVYIKFRDPLGNTSAFTYDEILYCQLYFVINGDNAIATTLDSTLDITLNPFPEDNVQMMISNYEDFNDGVWETFLTPKSWTLAPDEITYGVRTVYLKVRGATTREQVPVLDTIFYGVETVVAPTEITPETAIAVTRPGPRFLREYFKKQYEFEVNIAQDTTYDDELVKNTVGKLTPANTTSYIVPPTSSRPYDDMIVYRGVGRYVNKYDDFVLDTLVSHPDKILPFVSGFDPGSSSSLYYIERQLDIGFRGIGELFLFEIENRWLQNTITKSYLNNPNIEQICNIAASRSVPVVVHCDSQKAFKFENGDESLEALLEKCSNTIVIWAHTGLNRFTKTDHANRVMNLLQTHPNLYCDMSPPPLYPDIFDKFLQTIWQYVVQSYSTRFLMGTNITQMNFQEIVTLKDKYDQIGAAIGDENYKNIQYKNIARILGIAATKPIDSHTHLWTVDSISTCSQEQLELLFVSMEAAHINQVCLMGFPGEYIV